MHNSTYFSHSQQASNKHFNLLASRIASKRIIYRILDGTFQHICIMERNKRILIHYIIYLDCVFTRGVKALWDPHEDNENGDVLIFFLPIPLLYMAMKREAVNSRRSPSFIPSVYGFIRDGHLILMKEFVLALSEWKYFIGLLNTIHIYFIRRQFPASCKILYESMLFWFVLKKKCCVKIMLVIIILYRHF